MMMAPARRDASVESSAQRRSSEGASFADKSATTGTPCEARSSSAPETARSGAMTGPASSAREHAARGRVSARQRQREHET
jgi:hypothetical protein